MRANEVVSHYRIRRQLGAGGMGEVFLADDLELRRPVAIKLLTSEELSDDEDARLWRITSIWINDTEHTASTYLASIEGYPEEIGPFQFEVYAPDYP